MRGCLVAQAADSSIEDVDVVGVHHRLHHGDLGMIGEGRERPMDDGAAADRAVLLRSPGAGAQAPAGRDENGCSPLRGRHGNWVSMLLRDMRYELAGFLHLQRLLCECDHTSFAQAGERDACALEVSPLGRLRWLAADKPIARSEPCKNSVAQGFTMA